MINDDVGAPHSAAESLALSSERAAAGQRFSSPRKAELRLDLAFRNPLLEDAYLERIYRANRNWVIGVTILGLIMLFRFSSFDMTYIAPGQREAFHFIRIWVWAPALVAGLLIALMVKTPRAFIALTAVGSVYAGFCLAAMSYVGGPASIKYVSVFTFQFLLFVYFMSALPFRWAATVTAVTYAAQMAAVVALHPDGQERFWLPTEGVICFLMSIAAYRFEWTSRQNFLAQEQLQTEYSRRLASERGRIRWLETIAGFLRHELKNAMTGIRSSLALAEQTALDEDGSKYLERAKRSLEFMHRFLGQAAEATSLETALAEQELEPVNLSQLVAGRVSDYGEEIPDKSFAGNVEQDLWVVGNADRLVQMLDKLVNNAVEHGASAQPIEVSLRTERGRAILLVRDIGDALPSDLEQMFEPFASQKLRHGKGNLGLGLYVARVIAAHHGGTVHARRLQNPDGAELVVELPRSAESGLAA